MALSLTDKEKIDAMSHVEMARVLRFTRLGTWPFNDDEIGSYFLEKFHEAGGMTPQISRLIGWDE